MQSASEIFHFNLFLWKLARSCKKGCLILTFAKVNISTKNATHRLRQKISLLFMNTELENKYSEKKRKLKKEIKKICLELKRNLGLIILNTVLHQISVAVKSRLKNISKRHENKLFNLRKHNRLTKEVTRKLIITLRAPCPVVPHNSFQMMS